MEPSGLRLFIGSYRTCCAAEPERYSEDQTQKSENRGDRVRWRKLELSTRGPPSANIAVKYQG